MDYRGGREGGRLVSVLVELLYGAAVLVGTPDVLGGGTFLVVVLSAKVFKFQISKKSLVRRR